MTPSLHSEGVHKIALSRHLLLKCLYQLDKNWSVMY